MVWLIIKILIERDMRLRCTRLGGLLGYNRKAVRLAVNKGVTDFCGVTVLRTSKGHEHGGG